jgi:hypothetical protein
MSGSDDDRRAQLDDMLVELLAVGTSYAEAGALAGLSERTVRRRMSVPESPPGSAPAVASTPVPWPASW